MNAESTCSTVDYDNTLSAAYIVTPYTAHTNYVKNKTI